MGTADGRPADVPGLMTTMMPLSLKMEQLYSGTYDIVPLRQHILNLQYNPATEQVLSSM